MRARDIVGKKVARVIQERTVDNNKAIVYELKAVVFTDGTELQFAVAEMPSEYAVEGIVIVKKGEQVV